MRATKFQKLHPEAMLPTQSYPGDAGMDLHVVGEHTLNPGESRDLPSGVAVEFPPGYWGRIAPRSSTLRKRGLFVNEGIIDAGYRGELLTYVTNRTHLPVVIENGDRLAQLILEPLGESQSLWVDELAPSPRGTSGFGSTGTAGRVEDRGKDLASIAAAVPTAVGLRPASPAVLPLHAPRPSKTIYMGGPIDYVTDEVIFHDFHDWRHIGWPASLRIYCPICANRLRSGDQSWQAILARNTEALLSADVGVFDFRMLAPSVGTPIEAWKMLERPVLTPGPAVFLVMDKRYKESKPGVFISQLMDWGAIVVSDFDIARAVLNG